MTEKSLTISIKISKNKIKNESVLDILQASLKIVYAFMRITKKNLPNDLQNISKLGQLTESLFAEKVEPEKAIQENIAETLSLQLTTS